MTAAKKTAATKPAVADFDAWYAKEHPPIQLKILGKTWRLPAEITVVQGVRYAAVQAYAQTITNLPDETLVEELPEPPEGIDLDEMSREQIVRDFVGDELVEQWLEAGMRPTMLAEMASVLYRVYVGGWSIEDSMAVLTGAAAVEEG